MRIYLKMPAMLLLCTQVLYAQVKPAENSDPTLLKIAILPFENRTPNPNIDWVSNLFSESYKNELRKKYRFAEISDETQQKALELLHEYRLAGKVRFQVFAALTGADVVIGGYFAQTGGAAATTANADVEIQSQYFFSRNATFADLTRERTPLDSTQLLPAVDHSAQSSIEKITANSEQKPQTGTPLNIPYLPRLIFYTPAGQTGSARLRQILGEILCGNLTCDFVYREQPDTRGETSDDEAIFAANALKNEHAAYMIAVKRKQKNTEARLYSALEKSPVATFTSPRTDNAAAAIEVAKQIAATIAQSKFTAELAVSGLRGKDLTIEYSGVKKRETSKNGILDFKLEIPIGSDYFISVAAEPRAPAQRCFVINGKGRFTVTGMNHVQAVCITKRFAVEGTVEGLTGGDVTIQLNGTEAITLKENAPFRFPETFEDYETLKLSVTKKPAAPAQQCDFVDPPDKIEGKTVSLRLYCMPLRQHWLTLSGSYPVMQTNPARGDQLTPNGSFPLNNVNGNFNITAGYWTKYFLKFNYLTGIEATYVQFSGNADLYTANGKFVEANEKLIYNGVAVNLLLGYPFALPGKWLSDSRLVMFGGFGPRYVRLQASADISLLNTFGPGVTAGAIWQYELWQRVQFGIRYHADFVYIASEPLIIQHVIGMQVGYRL